jgi:hypothetical protein
VATLLPIVAVVPLLSELALVPSVFDVAEELDAELVRVELPGRSGQYAGASVGVVDDLARVADVFRHQA